MRYYRVFGLIIFGVLALGTAPSWASGSQTVIATNVDGDTIVADSDSANYGTPAQLGGSGNAEGLVVTASGDNSIISTGGGTQIQAFNGAGGTATNTLLIQGNTTVESNNFQVNGSSVLSGINDQSDGITNAGAISGATTINASGAITGGSLTDGTATLSGGALSGVTTIGASGLATLSGGVNSGNININDVTSGANNISGVGTYSATNGTHTTIVENGAGGTGGGGEITVANTSGTTQITLNGGNGNITAAGSITSGTSSAAGSVDVANGTGGNEVAFNGTGSSVIAGGASLYAAGTAASGSGNNVVVNSTSASLNSANGNNSVAVNNTNTTITGTGGSLAVGASQTSTVGVNSVTYGTEVNGGMLVNGDLGVNGNIYTLNPTANASVNVGNNGLSITGSTDVVTLTSDNDSNASNGRTQLTMTPTTGSLLVTNATTGVQEGLTIGQTNTVISGGTHSTSLTFDDNGATFNNDITNGPAQVHGVADGTAPNDAVNVEQLNGVSNRAYAGVASAIAMANLPPPAPGKDYSVGAAYGNYSDQDAFAVGVKAIVGKAKNVTLSVDYAYADQVSSVGAGVGYSF